MIAKDKLVFDVTDANTIAASDSVGAFVRDAAGALITSTLNQLTKQSLDVNITNAIAVDLDGIYNVSTNPTPDNVGIVAFTRALTPGLAEQGFLPTGAVPSDAVVNANIHALDINSFLMGYNGTTWDRLKSTSGDLNSHITNTSIAVTQSTSPWVVSATNLDIRDLTHVSDSVRLGDGTNFFTSTSENSDVALDVHISNSSIAVSDAALADAGIACVAKAVSTSGALLASQLTGRKYLFVQNLGSREIYVGPSGVSSSSGLRLSPSSVGEFRLGSSQSLHAVSAGGTQDCRLLELA
jgi:hypothetical protein